MTHSFIMVLQVGPPKNRQVDPYEPSSPRLDLFFPPLVEGKSAGNLQEIHGNPRMGMQKWDPTKWPVWQASFIGNMMIFH